MTDAAPAWRNCSTAAASVPTAAEPPPLSILDLAAVGREAAIALEQIGSDAVDAVADHLAELGFQRFMVEIGGEVRTMGSSARGVPWRIGIEDPRSDGSRKIYKVASLSGKAMATSGDYRIFFTHEDQTYSHILDPRSGYPIPRRTASVSVIADDCATADALATAFMIPEPAACIELVEHRPDLECMILEYGENDELKISKSSGFDRYLSSPAP